MVENVLKGSKLHQRDQSYNRIIEHRKGEKNQKTDNLSKKTEIYERQEQWEADRPEIKDRFSFTDKGQDYLLQSAT